MLSPMYKLKNIIIIHILLVIISITYKVVLVDKYIDN